MNNKLKIMKKIKKIKKGRSVGFEPGTSKIAARQAASEQIPKIFKKKEIKRQVSHLHIKWFPVRFW